MNREQAAYIVALAKFCKKNSGNITVTALTNVSNNPRLAPEILRHLDGVPTPCSMSGAILLDIEATFWIEYHGVVA